MPRISHLWRRPAVTLAILVALAALLGPTVTPSATASPTTTTVRTPSECTAAQLSFSRPDVVSAQMGEDAFTVTITNVSDRTCRIHGYPRVRFYTGAGRLLTFADTHTSLYFRRMSPRVLTVAPGAHAYFMVAKYRCDLGNKYFSSYFDLFAPQTTTPWYERVSGDGLGSGLGVMDYCKGPASGMGHDLGISAIVSTRTQLFT